MLYHLLTPHSSDFVVFNLFRYLSFRTGGAILTALLISFIFGPSMIRWLKSKQKEGQPIRSDGPESHLITKKGTPTMGGALMLLAITVSTLLWADLSNMFVWITLGVTLGFGLLGGVDDYLKLTKRNSTGVSGKVKLLVQVIIGLGATYAIQANFPPSHCSTVCLPFIKHVVWDIGFIGLTLFGAFVMVSSSNAVNLTDGLDGLATVPVMIASGCFLIVAYLVGNHVFSGYLQIQYVPGAGELAVICGALIGASLGFLWYNAPPAMVFMGDTGSLAVGGTLGVVSVITKHELVLVIVGGLFVIEALSVILQVGYFKLTGKRIFLMAPIHHHFEKKGWQEPTIVIRFWIVSIILGLLGLSTLKIR